MMRSVCAFVAIASISCSSIRADAFSLSLLGSGGTRLDDNGYDNLAWSYGGEFAHTLGPIEAGLFYERTAFSYSGGSDYANFFGAVGRFDIPAILNLFVDARVGLNKGSGAADFGSAFSYGFGVGYTISIVPTLSIRPRIGFKDLRFSEGGQSSSTPMFEFGALATFSLF